MTVLNGPVLAEDRDIGPNAVVKYLMLGSRLDLFTVDARTGLIYNLKTRTQNQMHTHVHMLLNTRRVTDMLTLYTNTHKQSTSACLSSDCAPVHVLQERCK